MITATAIVILAAVNSPFSEMLGIIHFFRISWEMEEEITNNKPAAVDKAEAKPPATTKAITHAGSLAISGLAKTIISRSTVNSLPFQPFGRAVAWTKAAFLSL